MPPPSRTPPRPHVARTAGPPPPREPVGTRHPGGGGQAVRATVKDAGGNTIGSAYTTCDRNDRTAETHTAFCTGLVRITNGAGNASGEISFSAVLPLDDQATVPEAGAFTGVANGGTKAFDGITGETRFLLRSANSYDLNFG
ncbi:hypothetical protein AB0O91_26485 [Kitasatospora sp. NPDC089797]|uniref:hypothetical protein n=1 Tax=Kitasatospora sp. NPDC089797 TaxID=3155298 RepID=UPI0034447A73